MMEVVAGNTLPKPWHDLENARKQRQKLNEETRKLRTTCEAENGTKHLTGCEKCYHQSLDLVQSTYSGATADDAWFSTRPWFKGDLAAGLQSVKDGEASLESIESRIEEEKEAWYREVLLENPDLLDLGCNDVRREDLLSSLADPECHIDDIINPVWDSLDKPEKWSDQLEAFLEKLSCAGTDANAVKSIYANEFFRDRTTGAALDHAQPYLDAFEGQGQDGTDVHSLDQVLEGLIRDLSAGKSAGSQRLTLRKRLDELTRARNALELDKAAQAEGRSAAGAREAAAVALLEPLPPCYVCEGVVDKTHILSCSHCQLAVQMAGEEGKAAKKLTLFCSDECLQKGQFKHEEEDHECAAKESCKSRTFVLPSSSSDDDDDVEMGDADSQTLLSPVACSQCVEEKELVVFCSSGCADANMAEHRHSKHSVKTDPDDSSGTYTPMEEVARMLDEATSGLKVTWHE